MEPLPNAAPADLTAGLFGKLPSHGDFVQRGWSAATVAALDSWLTQGMAIIAQAEDHDSLALRMTSAPLWCAYAPPGWAGPCALHFILSPSIDKAGRYFPLLCGLEGGPEQVWTTASQAPEFALSATSAVYDAVAAALDADALVATLAEAMPPPDASKRLFAMMASPDQAAFWTLDPPLALLAPTAEPGLLSRLLGEA